jgi:UDP-glucose 4-epimerase
MRILVTGGAGFIGSHLVDKLIELGNEVIVLDNLSSGKKEFIQKHFKNPNFKFYKVDLLTDKINDYFKNIDEVWHLAANPDVRAALKDTKIDINQNILLTHNVLEAMRENDVKKIFFTSSSTVYGEANKIPTPENYSPLMPISLYGSTKLACEALISSYCKTFDLNGIVFRLANIVGPKSTHGIIHDFINKLMRNPVELEILGDGNQRKSYLYIDDCIDAMITASENLKEEFDVYNVGSEDWITVKEIAKIVCEKLKLNPEFKFTGEERGWKGDVPKMLLDISKIKKIGWKPKYNSKDAIEITVENMVSMK